MTTNIFCVQCNNDDDDDDDDDDNDNDDDDSCNVNTAFHIIEWSVYFCQANLL